LIDLGYSTGERNAGEHGETKAHSFVGWEVAGCKRITDIKTISGVRTDGSAGG
jgi:hypothetical protein